MAGIPAFSYLYKTASYQQSVPEWKKTLQRNVKQIKMLAAATKEERKNELKSNIICIWILILHAIFLSVFPK